MTTKRFMVDDCGTLIDMQTRDTFDYVSDVCGLLNELHEENKQLKQYKKALWDWNSSKIIRVNRNTGEVDLVDKELEE